MPVLTSDSALITVLRLMPEAVATAGLPPRPSISGAAPATAPSGTSTSYRQALDKSDREAYKKSQDSECHSHMRMERGDRIGQLRVPTK